MRGSLTLKVLAFVLIPLAIQCALLASLAKLQSEAEAELKRSMHARDISDAINKITRDAYDTIATYGGLSSVSELSTDDPIFKDLFERLKRDYDELKALATDDPAILAAATKSEMEAKSALNSLIELKRSFDLKGESDRAYQKVLWKRIRASLKQVVREELAYVGEEQKHLAEKSPQIQAELRLKAQNLLIFTGAFDVFLALVLASIFVRNIVGKLNRMTDNAYMLASNLPLNPVLQGTDEISRLDQTFHKMAAELKAASKRETATFANARDIILSLEESGRVMAINPACERILRMRQQDMVGRFLVDLVVPNDLSKALDYLQMIRSAPHVPDLEVQMRDGDSNMVHVLWSGQWSQEENSFFLVIHDISDRKQAEELKREVISMITHDLRTPLSTINSILDLFNQGHHAKFEAKGLDLLKVAARNAQRMMVLINDLLDIEKISAGSMQLELEPLSIEKFFADCRDATWSFAEETGVQLVFLPMPLTVMADHQQLERVLSNIVSNAIKFSEKGCKVTVEARQQDGFVEISVKDEGPGIQPEMLETIFDKFQQAPNTSAKVKGGSGLGLAISKSIVELHGGKIWVRSEIGRGSTFTFSVPSAVDWLPSDD